MYFSFIESCREMKKKTELVDSSSSFDENSMDELGLADVSGEEDVPIPKPQALPHLLIRRSDHDECGHFHKTTIIKKSMKIETTPSKKLNVEENRTRRCCHNDCLNSISGKERDHFLKDWVGLSKIEKFKKMSDFLVSKRQDQNDVRCHKIADNYYLLNFWVFISYFYYLFIIFFPYSDKLLPQISECFFLY